MHVAFTIADRDFAFDLTYDSSFQADVSTRTWLAKHGCCEPELIHLMVRVLREGDFVVDVGANIGFFSIIMAQLVGPTGKVLAFEPGRNNLEKLWDNLSLNKLINVDVEKQALWSKRQELEFFLASDSGLNSCAPNEYSVSSVKIQGEVLDIFLRERAPRLIKIDAEGAEEEILRGAEATLDRGVDYLVVELNERALQALKGSQASMRDLMYRHGYQMFLLRPDGGMPILVPMNTVISPQNNNTNVLFSSVLDVGTAWPEITA